MATIGIEIVDAALLAARDGVRVAASPGIALVDGAAIVTGEAAAAAARLKPALVNDRYWSDLSTASLARAEDPVASHADLAHAQLAALWRAAAQPGDDAAFAVPGTMRPREIGLLLGIARHIGIPVAGLVDSAVAASAGVAARATVLHLDVQLYQAVLTEMQGAAILRRRRVEAAQRAGQKAMHAAWAQVVAEALVRRTRFDPMHEAATEQQLYQRLPEWLAGLATRESLDATLDTDGGSFTATVRREQFTLAAEAWYAQISELVHGGHRADEPATLLLSARAALLPALAERLGSAAGPRGRRAAGHGGRGGRRLACGRARARGAAGARHGAAARACGRGRGAPPRGRGCRDARDPGRPRLRDQRGAAGRRRGRWRGPSRRGRGRRHLAPALHAPARWRPHAGARPQPLRQLRERRAGRG